MSAFVVLLTALAGFRLLGALGASRFADWPASAAHGMAAMLVVTASAHFVPESVTVMPNHADMVRMVPPIVPFASTVVYLTGAVELLGAAGLVFAATRRSAGIGLAMLYALLLPANIYAAVAHVPFNGGEATPLWLRVPLQLLYITVALWVAGSSRSPAPGRLPALTQARPGG
ncbi:DoxX family protein [Allosalinactinospora lopnorensis]|uniref:DoxX family protein n=1 Tax=Allosalinactinospora lopnorensis TaxID=1352348 RepID=UPI000623DADD|nr:hypothetical protein [Allosalinactinospora lopnorensis]